MEEKTVKWMTKKLEGQAFFKDKNFEKAAEKYTNALHILKQEKNYNRNESSKLLANISFMFFNMFKGNLKEETLAKAKCYAQDAIDELPSWYKGYLRLAECYKVKEDIESTLNCLKMFLDVIVDIDIDVPNEFQMYMNSVKYFTHKTILMGKKVWEYIEYPDNFIVIDQKGAGHYKNLSELMASYNNTLKDMSIIIRPGVYLGTYILIYSTVQIIGDWMASSLFENMAIKDEPSVVLANAIAPVNMDVYLRTTGQMLALTHPNTFSIIGSKVIFRNVSLKENIVKHPLHAILANESTLHLFTSSFFSKCSAALAFDDSDVYIEDCQSIGAYSGLLSGKNSSCLMRNCYVSNTVGLGLEIRDDTKKFKLYNSVIENCQKQGICVYNGAQYVKIKGCSFNNNATAQETVSSPGSIQLRSCTAVIKDTKITNQTKSVGIVIESGRGKFENLSIHYCLTGMLVQAVVNIKRCKFSSCVRAVSICKEINGLITFDNNVMTNCNCEIADRNTKARIEFIGEKNSVISDVENMFTNSSYWEKRSYKINNRTNIDVGVDVGPVGEVFNLNERPAGSRKNPTCEYCGYSQFLLGKPLEFCDRCKLSLYCSKECQQKALKAHKPFCNDYYSIKQTTRASHTTKTATASQKMLSESSCQTEEEGNFATSNENDERTKLPEWKKKNKKKKKKKPKF